LLFSKYVHYLRYNSQIFRKKGLQSFKQSDNVRLTEWLKVLRNVWVLPVVADITWVGVALVVVVVVVGGLVDVVVVLGLACKVGAALRLKGWAEPLKN